MSVTDDIKLAAERAAGQPVTRIDAVPVMETFKGQAVWEGVVEVFMVLAFPLERVYAWAVKNGKETQYVAVLGTPPIDSPLAAVRAWLVSQSKK